MKHLVYRILARQLPKQRNHHRPKSQRSRVTSHPIYRHHQSRQALHQVMHRVSLRKSRYQSMWRQLRGQEDLPKVRPAPQFLILPHPQSKPPPILPHYYHNHLPARLPPIYRPYWRLRQITTLRHWTVLLTPHYHLQSHLNPKMEIVDCSDNRSRGQDPPLIKKRHQRERKTNWQELVSNQLHLRPPLHQN